MGRWKHRWKHHRTIQQHTYHFSEGTDKNHESFHHRSRYCYRNLHLGHPGYEDFGPRSSFS